MERKRMIRKYSLSIISTVLFLIIATCFIFLPKQKNMAGALSFLGKVNALSFVEISEDLSLNYDFPIPDEVGIETKPYEFQVVNNGSNSIKYQLSFFTGNGKNKVPQNSIRYRIQKNNEEYSEIQTLSEYGEILIDQIDGFSKNSYALKFWVHQDVDTSILGKTFQGIISLTAVK